MSSEVNVNPLDGVRHKGIILLTANHVPHYHMPVVSVLGECVIMLSDLTDKDFEQEVIKSDLPVLIDLWAPWCGPCRMIAPVVESLSKKYSGKLKFFRLNIDENPQTPSRYRVMSIPTLMFFKNGAAVDMVVGAVPEKAIIPKIEALL